MKNKRLFPFAISLIFLVHGLRAQDKSDYKFAKIVQSDFNLPLAKFDSGANAVIIADIGSTSFEGNSKGYFTLVFTRFLRVKIINKNGFDIGSQQIELYHSEDGDAEKLNSLKGSTFNIDHGVITETKLEEASVFTEKYNKNINIKKFSMPALKEGAIFDLQYTVKSPFETQLRPWEFQGEYPRLWSEYKVTIAPPFHYVMLTRGDQNFDVNTSKGIYGTFVIREQNPDDKAGADNTYSLSGESIEQHWIKKNVPALREEPYTTTLDNYNTRVAFQLSYFQWSNENEKHDYMTTWTNTSKKLIEDEQFGHVLSYENNWMTDELKNITQGANSDEEKTYKIYNYVRDNFKCASVDGYGKRGLYTWHSLKDVFKRKEGNVAEINLLLIAMLRKAGINADPLILSTRDNGTATTAYPLIAEYNYVICVAYVGPKIFKLDASEACNGFGQLPSNCFNGYGHIINEVKPLPVPLVADSVRETSVTSVFIMNDEKGKASGTYKNQLGKNESFDVRKEIIESSQSAYEKKIQTQNGSDLVMENFGIDSLKQYDYPIIVHFDFEYKNSSSADILYFNPMMDQGYKTNPFKSMERHYPVEMPYLVDETYLLNMDIPSGYQIDELPKSARVNYNDNEGFFEYIIQKGESSLQMRVRLKLNKAFFPVEEYSTLRDFFAYIVKTEGGQIVFKKIK